MRLMNRGSRRAPVDAVENDLSNVCTAILVVSNELAGHWTAAKQADLNALIERKARLEFERHEIIRKFFNS